MIDSDTLRQTALDGARAEYQELSDNWKQLEGKAQAMSTIAGIFLAAIFAFGDSGGKAISLLATSDGKVLATLVVIALTASILCAVFSLWVSVYDTPTDPRLVWQRIQKGLAEFPESPAQVYREITVDSIQNLLDVTAQIDRKNDIKASWVTWSQRFLVSGAMISSVLIAMRIWSG